MAPDFDLNDLPSSSLRDQVTQQNAALVEESAEAAESLNMQAIKVAKAVAVINLGTQGTPTIQETTRARLRDAPAAARITSQRLQSTRAEAKIADASATPLGEQWASF